MRARKSPRRSNGNPYESTKANRPRLYVRTYDQTQLLKDLKVQKHQKTAFRRIRLNVPGFVDPVIRSARISGRLFVRLKIGYLNFFDQQLTNFKSNNPKVQKSKTPKIPKSKKIKKSKIRKMSKKRVFSSKSILSLRLSPL